MKQEDNRDEQVNKNLWPAALDRATFEQFALRHRGRAYRFALAYTHKRELAEDLVQEALIRLYEHRERYPLQTHFGPYLVKILARLCFDQKRMKKSHASNRSTLQARAVTSVGPSKMAEENESRELIGRAMQDLPDRERVCLLLTVCEGFSYQEVAQALSISYSEVNNAVHRARTKLRAYLGPVLGS